MLVIPCSGRAADVAPQFAVVRLVNYDKSATNLVMAVAEFQALTAEIRAETLLFGRALAAASHEWKQDESHRSQSFPANAFWTRQATALGPVYDTEAKAVAALKPRQLSAAGMKPSRQPTKAELTERLILAAAQDLLLEQIDNLKTAPSPGAVSTESTNKIPLTAGQVLTRKIAGDPSHTTYHIAVPDNFKAEKAPPLLVVFSPVGNGMDMLNHVRASANKVGWLVIGCDNLRNGRSDEEELPIEKALLHDLRTFIPYDPARLDYGGMSGGALVGSSG